MSIRVCAMCALTVLVSVCPTVATAGGKPRANVLEAQFGARYRVLRDDVYSLLRFGGLEAQVALGYEHRWARHRLGMRGGFALGRMNNEGQHFPSRSSVLDFDLQYLTKVPVGGPAQQRHHIWLGAALASTNWLLYFNDYENLSWTTSQAAALRMEYERRFGERHSLVLRADLPVVAWVGRPPYAGYDGRISEIQDHPVAHLLEGEIGSLHNFLNPAGSMGYRLSLDKVTEIDLRYTSTYLWTTSRRRVRSLSNGASLAVRLRF